MSEDFPYSWPGLPRTHVWRGYRIRGPARGGRHGGGVPRARRAAYVYLAVAGYRQEDASSDPAAGLIPSTVPELLRLLHDTVIPPAGATGPTC